MSKCSAAERDESGLANMYAWWIAKGEDGKPAGAAGYQVWSNGLA